jgi:hypothetical protein
VLLKIKAYRVAMLRLRNQGTHLLFFIFLFFVQYLNYATTNRQEWEEKGAAVVAAMVEKCKREYGDGSGVAGTLAIRSANPVLPTVLKLKMKNENTKNDNDKRDARPLNAEQKNDEIKLNGSKTNGDSVVRTEKKLEEMKDEHKNDEVKRRDSNKSRKMNDDKHATKKKKEDDMICI